MSFSAKDKDLSEAILCISQKEGHRPIVVEIKDTEECASTYLADIIALSNKVPGFNGFTGFNIGILSSDLLLPMPEFIWLYRQIVQNYFVEEYKIPEWYKEFSHGVPKVKLFVSLQKGLSPVERQVVKNAISSLVDNESSNDIQNWVFVIDTLEEIEKIKYTMRLMKVVSLLICLITLVLALFMLIVSISSNISDSVYEIAVLRSMGMNGEEVTRVYVLEALSNNIAAILLGFGVGAIISATLGM